VNRYDDYAEMDQYGESILSKAMRIYRPPEASAIDRLAAVTDKAAARRVREWDAYVERVRKDADVIYKLTGTKVRFEFMIDVGDL